LGRDVSRKALSPPKRYFVSVGFHVCYYTSARATATSRTGRFDLRNVRFCFFSFFERKRERAIAESALADLICAT
jgi:hypothetical protein